MWDEVADDLCNSTNKDITKQSRGIDLDGDGGSWIFKQIVVDFKHKFLIPCWICETDLINAGGQFPIGIDPGDGEGAHGFGDGSEVIGGE